ncbi:pilus assembly protein PilP [Candidatus Woesearchaeota archaeon]|nr:pilus assembly protein PilP [Candidatus Woesearchaeota archaeon]
MKRYAPWILPVCLGLSSCQVDTAELDRFLTPARPPHLEPSTDPVASPDSSFPTAPLRTVSRDPFSPVKAPVEPTGAVIQPRNRRAREPLEAYPLNTLRWVGTLRRHDRVWALIQTHEGTVHRVQTGAYLGENGGQLVAIETSRLSIREIEWPEQNRPHEYVKYIDAKRNDD